MSTLLNDNDLALQGSVYRDKTTLASATATVTNFITGKNGGATTPSSTTLTAVPNSVFTNAAVYTWEYALSSAPTTWKPVSGGFVSGTIAFTRAGTAASAANKTWSNVGQSSTSGSGTGATFNITKTGTTTAYSGNISVTTVNPGIGYVAGEIITISGSSLGGTSPANDLTLTVPSSGALTSNIGTSITLPNTTIVSMIGASKATSITFRVNIAETLLDTAYGYVIVNLALDSATNDPILVELSRVAVVLPAAPSGTVTSYNSTDSRITVSRGGNYLSYDSAGSSVAGGAATSTANSFAVEISAEVTASRTLGTISTGSTYWQLDSISNMSLDYTTVNYNIYIYDASGNKTSTVQRQTTYTKAISGSNGEPSSFYYIETNAPVIYKSVASAIESGSHTTSTIYTKRSIGSSPGSTYGFFTITANGAAEAVTATAMTNTGYLLSPNNGDGKTSYTVKMYNAAAITNADTKLLDTQVIPVLFTGSNALTIAITNDNAPIVVSKAGVPLVGAYAGTTTLVRVYEGTKELTYDPSFDPTNANQANGTYKVTAVGQSSLITPGTITKVTNTIYATVGAASGIQGDTATVTYTIAGKGLAGTLFGSNGDQSFFKSYPGSDAQLNYLLLSSPVISKSTSAYSIDGIHTNITATGKQTLANGTPTTVGYLTGTGTYVATNTTASANTIKLSNVSTFLVNAPIIFTGTTFGNIVSGTTYYIKAIDAANNVITVSATRVTGLAQGVLSLSTSSGLMFATSESETATQSSITTVIPNNAGILNYTVRLYDSAAKTTLWDSAILPVLFTGSNNLTPILTNENASIPCDSTGAVISGGYDNTTTDIQVYEGTTLLTYDGVGSAPGKFKITATGTGITPGAISTISTWATVAVAGSISVALPYITFKIDGVSLAGNTFSVSKKQTFNKLLAGTPGNPGTSYKSALVTAFQWGTASVPTISGTLTYRWSDNTVTTAYPTGWYAAAQSSSNQQTLWQITVNVNDVSTATTTNVLWTTGKIGRIGYREDGSIGDTGDAARICYRVVTATTAGTLPGAPAQPTSTNNSGDVAPTNWSFSATTNLAVDQAMYQCDGTYNVVTNRIIWREPYLSNLKVGNLSAISANLGSITGGALNINNKFIVLSDGTTTIQGATSGARMMLTTNSLKVYDSTGALRVQLGNLDS